MISVTEDLLAINNSTFHQTRGHSLKLTKNRSRLDIRKYYFTNRVVEDWNNLPETVITTKNVKKFENRLDKLWQNHPMMYEQNAIPVQIVNVLTMRGLRKRELYISSFSLTPTFVFGITFYLSLFQTQEISLLLYPES
jgi:hypothetical protein